MNYIEFLNRLRGGQRFGIRRVEFNIFLNRLRGGQPVQPAG